MAEIEWTRHQQAVTLQAVEILKAAVSSKDPSRNVAAMGEAVARLVPGGADASDAEFAKVATDLVGGLANLAATLAEHSAQRSGVSLDHVIADVVESVQAVKIVG